MLIYIEFIMDFFQQSLTDLNELKVESIHITPEVTACFFNPIMLYSVGKDSILMGTY
jgi:3'-phosphoadenosine 5'-phosphosulfate sulfotransferase (PAPS reductase)/FAD synthetase